MFLFKDLFLCFSCMHVCEPRRYSAHRDQKGATGPQDLLRDGCEPSCGRWESNSRHTYGANTFLTEPPPLGPPLPLRPHPHPLSIFNSDRAVTTTQDLDCCPPRKVKHTPQQHTPWLHFESTGSYGLCVWLASISPIMPWGAPTL